MDKQEIQQEKIEAKKEVAETLRQEHIEETAEGKHSHEHHIEGKKEEGKHEHKTDKTEIKSEDKKEKKKEHKKQEIKAKEYAVVNAFALRISPKYSYAICKAIKRKSPQKAIEFLELVIRGKRPIKMTGRELGHQKSRGQKGVAGGAFPKNASQEFIEILKQLEANASVNQVDNPVITQAIANKGAEPYKREGRKGKRTHVFLEVRDKTKLMAVVKQAKDKRKK